MNGDWSEQWSGNCPNCSVEWVHDERLIDGRTEHKRDGYTRLSDWTLQCDTCDYINNSKRQF